MNSFNLNQNNALPSFDPSRLKGSSVLVRLDLNIPAASDCQHPRILGCVGLLQELLLHQAKPIILTHWGNPEPPTSLPATSNPASTSHLVPCLTAHGLRAVHAATLSQAADLVIQEEHGTILLLENLRFFAGEKQNDTIFAQQLAQLGQYYLNNAFGTIHRPHASVVALPQLFAPDHRFTGPLVLQECHQLSSLLAPRQPFLVALGGAKLSDKLPLLQGLLDKAAENRPQKLLLGGSLALPFLVAQAQLPKIYATDVLVGQATTLHILARQQACTLQLPTDLRVVDVQTNRTRVVSLPYTGSDPIVDIGPDTARQFATLCTQAQTIFANGTMGRYETEGWHYGSQEVLQAIAANNGVTIIGGGNAVDAAQKFGLADHMTFCSTGGGASLAFLAAQDPWHELPGLAALIRG